MFRGLVKLAVFALVLVAIAFFYFGYRTSGAFRPAAPSTAASAPDRTTSTPDKSVNVAVARERGAELGEQVARTATRVNETIEEGALTAKIKAKMVLDDLVKARSINVTTTGSTVTLTGHVYSEAERDRAVQLADETQGVTKVIDRLDVRQP